MHSDIGCRGEGDGYVSGAKRRRVIDAIAYECDCGVRFLGAEEACSAARCVLLQQADLICFLGRKHACEDMVERDGESFRDGSGGGGIVACEDVYGDRGGLEGGYCGKGGWADGVGDGEEEGEGPGLIGVVRVAKGEEGDGFGGSLPVGECGICEVGQICWGRFLGGDESFRTEGGFVCNLGGGGEGAA